MNMARQRLTMYGLHYTTPCCKWNATFDMCRGLLQQSLPMGLHPHIIRTVLAKLKVSTNTYTAAQQAQAMGHKM